MFFTDFSPGPDTESVPVTGTGPSGLTYFGHHFYWPRVTDVGVTGHSTSEVVGEVTT